MTHDARASSEAGIDDAALDVRIDSPGREGLTGTTPANLYTPTRDAEQITRRARRRPMDQQPAWRQDFPIDWPQDQYVARRDFMKFMVLTSLAFTVGQFWIARAELVAPAPRRSRRSGRIAALDELPVGGALTFAYPGRARRLHPGSAPSADALVAYSQKCTHLSCAVVPRRRAGHRFDCPATMATSTCASGRPVAGPAARGRCRASCSTSAAATSTRPASRRGPSDMSLTASVHARPAHDRSSTACWRSSLMLVILQLWLLTATMNAYLGGDESVIWPAAARQPRLPVLTPGCCATCIASIACDR